MTKNELNATFWNVNDTMEKHAKIAFCEHLQLLVSFATATIPIGWWGMSARSTFVSPPVNLLVRSTARRAQSDQKM